MPTNFEQYSTRDQAQMLFNLREQASELRRKLSEIENAVAGFQQSLLTRLEQNDDGQRFVRCAAGTVTAVWKSQSVVENLAQFQAHIIATGELDLLQNRVSEEAVRQRWDVGNSVPGIARRDFMRLSLSTTKKEPSNGK